MHGRVRERQAIDELLRKARRGRSSVTLIEGEPGIGKTCLCDYAAAEARDVVVLQSKGVESEARMPFAGLAQLLVPLSGHFRRLPDPQRHALHMALAREAAVPIAPFVLGMALLGLLTVAAEQAPLLAIVDDLHWIDVASGQAITFAARRLDREAVALLLSRRSTERDPLEDAQLDRLRLVGLPSEPAASLLSEVAGHEVSSEVTGALLAGTAGNPLALIEAVRSLPIEVLEGRAAVPNPLPLDGRVGAMFHRRVAELPGPTQDALLVVAADTTGSLTLVAPALAALGIGMSTLEPAEAIGVIDLEEGCATFDHPVLRSAVYQGASPAEQRRAHSALASAAAASGDLEREAWHLAAAATGPDERVAARLERSGERAALLGGAVAAAPVLEQAAILTPGGRSRVRRLITAAEALFHSGDLARIDSYIDEALRNTTDAHARADAIRVQGQLMVARGQSEAAVDLVCGEARRLAVVDPEKAALMLCESTLPAVRNGDTARALEISLEVAELAPPGGFAELLAQDLVGHLMLFRGKVNEAEHLLRQVHAAWRSRPPNLAVMVPGPAVGLFFMEEYGLASEVLDRDISEARATGVPMALPQSLATRAEVDYQTGNWTRAYAAASECTDLARTCGQRPLIGYGLVGMARIEAALGQEDRCRGHASEAYEIGNIGGRYLHAYADAAIGLLEIGRDDAEAAAACLSRAYDNMNAAGNIHPGNARLGGELVDALARCGDPHRAAPAIQTLEAHATRSRTVWAQAAALRARGVLAAEEDADDLFCAALVLHGRTNTPFELARTELCFGERLSLRGDAGEAVPRLRRALAVFEQLGARPWAERARRGLELPCEAAVSGPGSWLDALTPRELEVACMVAEGASNKDAASALFLSPKTVEFHLGNVYRKLSVRSRSQLTRLLVNPADSATPPERSS